MWLAWAVLVGSVVTITCLMQSVLAVNTGDVRSAPPDEVGLCRILWSRHVDVGVGDSCASGAGDDASTPVVPASCWDQAADALLNGDEALGRWIQEACARLPVDGHE
jgi:hypothetical protein